MRALFLSDHARCRSESRPRSTGRSHSPAHTSPRTDVEDSSEQAIRGRGRARRFRRASREDGSGKITQRKTKTGGMSPQRLNPPAEKIRATSPGRSRSRRRSPGAVSVVAHVGGFSAKRSGLDRSASIVLQGIQMQSPESFGIRTNQEERDVDKMPVGRMVSLLRLQGCREYAPIDIENKRLHRDLQRLRENSVDEFKEEIHTFWGRLKARLRGADCSSSPERKTERRRKRWKDDGKEEVAEETDPALVAMNVQVEAFIHDNCIDCDAARVFRKAAPEVKHYILKCGTLRQSYNPSSALTKRITDARKLNLPPFFGPTATAPSGDNTKSAPIAVVLPTVPVPITAVAVPPIANIPVGPGRLTQAVEMRRRSQELDEEFEKLQRELGQG